MYGKHLLFMFHEEEWTNRNTSTHTNNSFPFPLHCAIVLLMAMNATLSTFYFYNCFSPVESFRSIIWNVWSIVTYSYHIFYSSFRRLLHPVLSAAYLDTFSLQANYARHSFLCFWTERVNLHIKSRLCTKNEYEAMRWRSDISGYGEIDRWRAVWHRFSNNQMNKIA